MRAVMLLTILVSSLYDKIALKNCLQTLKRSNLSNCSSELYKIVHELADDTQNVAKYQTLKKSFSDSLSDCVINEFRKCSKQAFRLLMPQNNQSISAVYFRKGFNTTIPRLKKLTATDKSILYRIQDMVTSKKLPRNYSYVSNTTDNRTIISYILKSSSMTNSTINNSSKVRFDDNERKNKSCKFKSAIKSFGMSEKIHKKEFGSHESKELPSVNVQNKTYEVDVRQREQSPIDHLSAVEYHNDSKFSDNQVSYDNNEFEITDITPKSGDSISFTNEKSNVKLNDSSNPDDSKSPFFRTSDSLYFKNFEGEKVHNMEFGSHGNKVHSSPDIQNKTNEMDVKQNEQSPIDQISDLEHHNDSKFSDNQVSPDDNNEFESPDTASKSTDSISLTNEKSNVKSNDSSNVNDSKPLFSTSDNFEFKNFQVSDLEFYPIIPTVMNNQSSLLWNRYDDFGVDYLKEPIDIEGNENMAYFEVPTLLSTFINESASYDIKGQGYDYDINHTYFDILHDEDYDRSFNYITSYENLTVHFNTENVFSEMENNMGGTEEFIASRFGYENPIIPVISDDYPGVRHSIFKNIDIQWFFHATQNLNSTMSYYTFNKSDETYSAGEKKVWKISKDGYFGYKYLNSEHAISVRDVEDKVNLTDSQADEGAKLNTTEKVNKPSLKQEENFSVSEPEVNNTTTQSPLEVPLQNCSSEGSDSQSCNKEVQGGSKDNASEALNLDEDDVISFPNYDTLESALEGKDGNNSGHAEEDSGLKNVLGDGIQTELLFDDNAGGSGSEVLNSTLANSAVIDGGAVNSTLNNTEVRNEILENAHITDGKHPVKQNDTIVKIKDPSKPHTPFLGMAPLPAGGPKSKEVDHAIAGLRKAHSHSRLKQLSRSDIKYLKRVIARGRKAGHKKSHSRHRKKFKLKDSDDVESIADLLMSKKKHKKPSATEDSDPDLSSFQDPDMSDLIDDSGDPDSAKLVKDFKLSAMMLGNKSSDSSDDYDVGFVDGDTNDSASGSQTKASQVPQESGLGMDDALSSVEEDSDSNSDDTGDDVMGIMGSDSQKSSDTKELSLSDLQDDMDIE